MNNCPNCTKLQQQLAELRRKYDRVFTGASIAWKYKRDRDDAREEIERLKEQLGVLGCTMVGPKKGT